MKLASPKLISFLAGAALVGLCIVQYYWIDNAVKQRHENFEQDVRDVLAQVSYKYGRQRAAARIRRQLNYRKQGVMLPITTEATPINKVSVIEEYTSDSNGFIDRGSKSRSYLADSFSHEFSDKISADNTNTNFKSSADKKSILKPEVSTSSSSEMLNDIFDELISINIYNDYSNQIDTSLVDSLLRTELCSRGISTQYAWAIINAPTTVFTSDSKTRDQIRDSLLMSRYRVNLTPDNIFIQPRMLSLYFPNESGYIFKSMWGVLLLSVLFILFIILLFYYSISTIFKQKKLSEIKNDFIGNMTHELKTPISTISLACEVLSDDSIEKNKERTDRYVTMIREENKRLALLVENVLQTAVLDKGNFKLKPSAIDLHNLIEGAIRNIKVQVEKKNGEITTDFQATISELIGDRTHIQNVIYNLLDNAIKYTPNQPLIRITTVNTANGIEFCVEDNGVGINRENQKKIFDTLYRVPTGNVHDVKGFGLGLSYVKAIIDKHGGYVRVESDPGHGSRFYVQLPFQNAQL
ncbi:MAG: sensor histidine kinase [Bacteroidia bacterium]